MGPTFHSNFSQEEEGRSKEVGFLVGSYTTGFHNTWNFANREFSVTFVVIKVGGGVGWVRGGGGGSGVHL